MGKKASFVYFFGFILMAVLVLMMFSSFSYSEFEQGSFGYYIFTNSDASLLYQVSTDLLKHPASLLDWNFGTCFYFFPNLLIMLLATAIFSNPSVAIFASSIMLFSILVILVNILFIKIIPGISKYSLVISNLSILAFILYTINTGDFSYLSSHLFLPLHLGAFINTILALIFVYNYLQKKSLKFIVYLSILNILAVFSDMIYLIYFIFPILLVFISFLLFVKKFRKKEHYFIMGSLMISGFLGYIILQTIINNGILDLYPLRRMPENISFSFHLLFDNLKEFSLKHPLAIIMSIIIILTSIFIVYVILRTFFKSKKGSSNDSFNVEIYLLYCLYFLVIAIASPIINGSYQGTDCIRYIMPPFYLIIFNTGLILEYILLRSKRKNSVVAFASISLIVFYSFFILKNHSKYPAFSSISKIRDYYPELAKATDELSQRYDIKNGFSGYWSSRFITVFSKEDVMVNIADSDFRLVAWANNPYYYFYTDYEHNSPVVYNFVVLKSLKDTSMVYHVFSQDEINKVKINGFDFYVLPDFVLKGDFSNFEILKMENIK